MTKKDPAVSWSTLKAAIAANPNKSVALGGGPATSSLTSLPSDSPVTWLPGWSEDPTAILDSISLALWIHDPMYRSATESVKGLMEMEEAAALLHDIETAWKDNGRGHGWVRKHLEEDLRARAGGAPATPDTWNLVRQQKRQAQLVDYVCTLRKIRVGLWWPEQRTVTNIPALYTADPIVMIQCETNRVLIGDAPTLPVKNWPALVMKADMEWFVPPCAPSIGATTVAQIIESLQAIKPGSYKGSRNHLWKLLQFERTISGYPASPVP